MLVTVWRHHAKRSGYSPVVDGLGLGLRRDRLRFLPKAFFRRKAGPADELANQINIALKVTGRNRLLVIDGDFELGTLIALRQETSARLYAVFHQIPEVLESLSPQFSPGLLDGVVCVARCQMPLVESMAPAGCTWFIPHGIDTDYFRPTGSRSGEPLVICVGVHRRDFDTLRRSAAIIRHAIPNTAVKLIAAPSALPVGLDLGQVELLSGLDDEALRHAYQQAWVVLLPLTAATANNSLLEAMACGTPVVATDIGGIRDYMAEDCGALCPAGDAEAHAASVCELLRDPARRLSAGRVARVKAEALAWPRIRERLRVVLQTDGHQAHT